MSNDMECPDCGEVLNAYARKCACGWTKVKKTSNKKPPENICICQWKNGQERCPMPASRKTEATHNRWFCGPHADAEPNDKGKAVYDWINKQLNGEATHVHNFYLSTIHQVGYWGKSDNEKTKELVYKVDKQELTALRKRNHTYMNNVRKIILLLEKHYHGKFYEKKVEGELEMYEKQTTSGFDVNAQVRKVSEMMNKQTKR